MEIKSVEPAMELTSDEIAEAKQLEEFCKNVLLTGNYNKLLQECVDGSCVVHIQTRRKIYR